MTSFLNQYHGLLGLNDENSVCDTKKLFSFLKCSKQDQLGSTALNHGHKLVTNTAEKADIHNLHFQSVFTTKEPLSLSRLCKMKLHDAADSGKIPSELLPPEMQKSTPVMEDFSISVAGILKLLKSLKPWWLTKHGPSRTHGLVTDHHKTTDQSTKHGPIFTD